MYTKWSLYLLPLLFTAVVVGSYPCHASAAEGQHGTHRQLTEGERVFPLEKIEVKTSGIDEGSLVTVEVNEMGSVIDLHRAKRQ
jgi:hypothetical protein